MLLDDRYPSNADSCERDPRSPDFRAKKEEAAASAGFCKNNRPRLMFRFQLRSPVRFVYDAYCFCIAHFIGQALSDPLSAPLPKRYWKIYFIVPLLSRYQSVTQPLPDKKC